MSDHSIAVAELSLPAVLKSDAPKLVHDYNKGNVAQVEKSLDAFQFEIEPFFSEITIELSWNIIKDKFNDLALKLVSTYITQTSDRNS